MSMAGDGVIAIWHDVPAELRADYFEWHDREHVPERVAIPGFRRGRRWIALEGAPEFFTLYETDGPQIHTGADYLLRLNNPTDWSRRVAPKLTNNVRSLCRVAMSLGTGQGGLAMTYRFDVAEGQNETMRRHLAQRVLPELADRPGIAGAHLCIADQAASNIQTEEKRSRPTQALVPTWVIIVEGAADRRLLDAACADLLSLRQLTDAGARAPIDRGLYQLQYSRTKTASTGG